MKLNIRRVVLLSLLSRLVCITLSFLVNDLFSGIRNTGILSLHLDVNSKKYQDTAIWKFLKSFINWDGEYYLRVSFFGDYEYEHQHAFFPLYPLMVNLLSKLLYNLSESKIIINMIVGVFLSNLAFVIASAGLYLFQCELSKRIKMKDVVFPGISTLFFIFPSSNIFNSAMYSESLFACFNFWSALFILKAEHYSNNNGFYSPKNVVCLTASVTLMAFTSGIRSNGILNSIPLFLYFLSTTPLPSKNFSRIALFLVHWLIAFISFVISVSPFLAHLTFSYLRYCINPTSPRPWCHKFIPDIYSFVQSEYWNNGPFNYWKIQKIDRFIIVMPYIIVSLASLNIFLRYSKENNLFKGFNNALVFIGYAIQIYFLLLTISVSGYIEVLLRLFNCIPAFFTFIGYFYRNYPKYSKYILAFQIFSFIFGNIWFPNFLPWT
ncbi:multi-pass transmembrane protein [Cryptosporidium ryanae]|uniref:multi-pass transmembrane protein n=1 Tax=Cryptosporidium ryanae TaxID=515981 RepID=UPI003519E98A|nr:multi-pass transmembrane protein [Cryptosporidium ryanae]